MFNGFLILANPNGRARVERLAPDSVGDFDEIVERDFEMSLLHGITMFHAVVVPFRGEIVCASPRIPDVNNIFLFIEIQQGVIVP